MHTINITIPLVGHMWVRCTLQWKCITNPLYGIANCKYFLSVDLDWLHATATPTKRTRKSQVNAEILSSITFSFKFIFIDDFSTEHSIWKRKRYFQSYCCCATINFFRSRLCGRWYWSVNGDMTRVNIRSLNDDFAFIFFLFQIKTEYFFLSVKNRRFAFFCSNFLKSSKMKIDNVEWGEHATGDRKRNTWGSITKIEIHSVATHSAI